MKNKQTFLVMGLFVILPILCFAQYNPDSQDDISKSLSKRSYSPGHRISLRTLPGKTGMNEYRQAKVSRLPWS